MYSQSSLHVLLATGITFTKIYSSKFISTRIVRALETRVLCPNNLSILSAQVTAGDTVGAQ